MKLVDGVSWELNRTDPPPVIPKRQSHAKLPLPKMTPPTFLSTPTFRIFKLTIMNEEGKSMNYNFLFPFVKMIMYI